MGVFENEKSWGIWHLAMAFWKDLWDPYIHRLKMLRQRVLSSLLHNPRIICWVNLVLLHINLAGQPSVGHQRMDKEVENEDISASWGTFPLVLSVLDESLPVLKNSNHWGWLWINHDAKTNSGFNIQQVKNFNMIRIILKYHFSPIFSPFSRWDNGDINRQGEFSQRIVRIGFAGFLRTLYFKKQLVVWGGLGN